MVVIDIDISTIGQNCFRSTILWNNNQNISSHLELIMLENSGLFAFYLSKYQALFSEITSSRWKEENNRLLFSVTGIDHQGHICVKM